MPEPYVSIPETITVHLGAPSADAQNITVPFADYIKNVASSEIYPTWPEQAIRANVYAQISYVLNRVFTEWYRAQGYDFDITNSTRYDQSFVPGRDIFENISTIVDDMIGTYLTRGDSIEPLFTQYCNGTTVTCPGGLSQWGTVPLAEQGLSAEQILQSFYGAQPRRVVPRRDTTAGRLFRGCPHCPDPPQPHFDQFSEHPEDISHGRRVQC